MAYDRAASKAAARRAVHTAMGVAADYEDSNVPGRVGLRVRWHNRVGIDGNLVEAGYSNFVEGINRVIFDKQELDEKGVVLSRGSRVYMADGAVLILSHQEPITGPIEVVWGVAQE